MGPQTEFFYQTPSNNLRAVYNMDGASRHRPDTVNDTSLVATTSSSMAGYGPYVAYLSENNEMQMLRNKPVSYVDFTPTVYWEAGSVNVSVMEGSRLAVVPLATNITSLFAWGNYAVIYQHTDGMLAFLRPIWKNGEVNGTWTDSWPGGKSAGVLCPMSRSKGVHRLGVPIHNPSPWRLLCGFHNSKPRQRGFCEHVHTLPRDVITNQHGLPWQQLKVAHNPA